jgi:uncharacterized protein (TIGR03435 family)
MLRPLVCVTVASFMCGSAFSQSAEKPARFEAADVHVSPHTRNPSMNIAFIRGGRYEIKSATMLDLIRTAYGVDGANVFGGPSWLETDRFDVIAKGPSSVNPDSVRPMLQALLADRFQLVVHNDTKPMSAYALTAGKRPLLKQSASDAATAGSGCQSVPADAPNNGFAYACHNMTMAAFVSALPNLARPYIGGNIVADLTGLKGAWDFNLKFSRPVMLTTGGGDAISLADAVDQQLGLKIELQKVPIPVIVVDSVNQKPSWNADDVAAKLPPLPTEFEVADIKPSLPETKENVQIQPGGRINATGISLKDLVKFAWNLDDDDMLSGPKWMTDERFDIVAKATYGDQTDDDTLELMLRALLVDRFKLKSHFEDEPVTVYALLAPKPKMKTADPANRSTCKNAGAGGGANTALFRNFACQNATMTLLTERLNVIAPGYIDHPVVDLTGLTGAYDFSFSFSGVVAFQARGTAESNDPNGAVSLFEALEKQLGLKLEVQKHPMPVLVIDHMEQKPTDN